MTQRSTSIRKCIPITVTTIRFGGETGGDLALDSDGRHAIVFALKMTVQTPNSQQAFLESIAVAIILINNYLYNFTSDIILSRRHHV